MIVSALTTKQIENSFVLNLDSANYLESVLNTCQNMGVPISVGLHSLSYEIDSPNLEIWANPLHIREFLSVEVYNFLVENHQEDEDRFVWDVRSNTLHLHHSEVNDLVAVFLENLRKEFPTLKIDTYYYIDHWKDGGWKEWDYSKMDHT